MCTINSFIYVFMLIPAVFVFGDVPPVSREVTCRIDKCHDNERIIPGSCPTVNGTIGTQCETILARPLAPPPLTFPTSISNFRDTVEGSGDENEDEIDENALSSFNREDIDLEIKEAQDAENEITSRFFVIGLSPGRPPSELCDLPKPFPQKCVISMTELYGEEPPVNIPYCHRIPCAKQNLFFDKYKRLCHTQPGCYFDYELWKHRQRFGQKFFPGVPICHLAIRNKVFLEKARRVKRWSSYFTNCLYNTFTEEIESLSNGCAMLSLLREFKRFPKMTGWPNIQESDCKWIGGCWDNGRCFHETNITQLKVKSHQMKPENRLTLDESVPHGRVKCQDFNTRNPSTILDSIHNCLSSGCTVDFKAWMQYRDLFYYIGMQGSPVVHAAFRNAQKRGEVGPHNAVDLLFTYIKANEDDDDSSDSNTASPVIPPTPISEKDCGGRGKRPCPPATFKSFGLPGEYNFSPFCPYNLPPLAVLKTLNPLKGSLAGCCDSPPICYFPRLLQHEASSGIATYYGMWEDWRKCSKTCGGGEQIRYRVCVAKDDFDCVESTSEKRACNTRSCFYWTPWTEWEECSKSCGSGTQSKTRDCLPGNNISDCSNIGSGVGLVTRNCNEHNCGDKYSIWSEWDGTCRPCGKAITRERTCLLAPENCDPEELKETKQCEEECGECAEYPPYSACKWNPILKFCFRSRVSKCSKRICSPPCIQSQNCPPMFCPGNS